MLLERALCSFNIPTQPGSKQMPLSCSITFDPWLPILLRTFEAQPTLLTGCAKPPGYALPCVLMRQLLQRQSLCG